MVETISRSYSKSSSLDEALKKLANRRLIHPTLKAGFEKMYYYTNGEDGIRHALMDSSNNIEDEARFFFVACSAFTNYLIEKGQKNGLLEDNKLK